MEVFFFWLLSVVGGIVVMPFFTLYERKILSYIQNRKGPKKVSVLGMLQPILDGVKLILKEGGFVSVSNMVLFFFSSFLTFILMIFMWILFPVFYGGYYILLGVMGFLCISSLNVYGLMGCGFSSKSKYSLLGGIRGAAQVVSYEVSLFFVILFPCFCFCVLKFWDFYLKGMEYFLVSVVVFSVWLVVLLAETNRSPFDFAEGESELVSGFNTEYSALGFVFLFLGEYGQIVLMSLFTSFLFFGGVFFGWFIYLTFSLMVMSFFIWSRGTLPRFRYDFLMVVAWKIMLPMSVFCLVMLFSLVYMS